MSDTRERLMEAAISALKRQGISGVSARTIAGEIGANQALVFYHFKTVEGLLAAAVLRETGLRLDRYRPALDAADSLRELLSLGQRLHQEERAAGNVALLGQFLAGSTGQPRLAEATAAALQLWTDELQRVLERLYTGHPLGEFLDLPGLARAVAAAFVGLELYDGVDPQGAAGAFAALDRLGALVEVVDGLGPVVSRAVRAKVRREVGRGGASE
ncbi:MULTISPECIES: TetR/AcrR family transcriptional regulator [unclassified Streptomyces]|uniref:TetR/AcrR family transcriptional regulator n=1 Tax=unclassified Streptomyces TaxID=2593676 RepID=UPI0005F92874|nr:MULTISPECIES: TetR/AcrR family transcriptional regulator [unclassified Streptomyces]KJY33098.1 TetR family transcriptional regulator [Streptomyces sp. NRRL S-495]KOV10061.1 TetR family transcriptional regulator [Streptomyces sp. XY431]